MTTVRVYYTCWLGHKDYGRVIFKAPADLTLREALRVLVAGTQVEHNRYDADEYDVFYTDTGMWASCSEGALMGLYGIGVDGEGAKYRDFEL